MSESPSDIFVMLHSSNPRERAQALTIIGKKRYYFAYEYGIHALRDSDDDVRAMAAWALDRLNSPAAVPALLSALSDLVFTVRSNAAWALVHIAQRMTPEMVVPDVVDVLMVSDDADTCEMACLVLYQIGGEAAQEAIRRYKDRHTGPYLE